MSNAIKIPDLPGNWTPTECAAWHTQRCSDLHQEVHLLINNGHGEAAEAKLHEADIHRRTAHLLLVSACGVLH